MKNENENNELRRIFYWQMIIKPISESIKRLIFKLK
jgi:hypothetical protein